MRKQAIKVLVSLAAGVLFSVGAGAQLPEKVGDTPVPSLAPIVKKASPAVVNIATRGTLRERYWRAKPGKSRFATHHVMRSAPAATRTVVSRALARSSMPRIGPRYLIAPVRSP